MVSRKLPRGAGMSTATSFRLAPLQLAFALLFSSGTNHTWVFCQQIANNDPAAARQDEARVAFLASTPSARNDTVLDKSSFPFAFLEELQHSSSEPLIRPAPAAPSSSPVNPAEYDRVVVDPMMLQEIRKKQLENTIRLQDLTIIGSHDSGSVQKKFTLSKLAVFGAQTVVSIFHHGAGENKGFLARRKIAAAENWETQKLSILGQIQAGARWFDLRFDEFEGADENQGGGNGKEIRAYHGDSLWRMPGVPAEEVFKEIWTFCFDKLYTEESQDQLLILNLKSTPEVAVKLLKKYFSPGSGETEIRRLGNLLVSNDNWNAVEGAEWSTSSDRDKNTPFLASLTIADVKRSTDESAGSLATTSSSQHSSPPRIILTYKNDKDKTKRGFEKLKDMLKAEREAGHYFANRVFDVSKEFQGSYSASAQISKVMEDQTKKFQTFLHENERNIKDRWDLFVGMMRTHHRPGKARPNPKMRQRNRKRDERLRSIQQPFFKTYFTFTGKMGNNPVSTMLKENTEWYEKQNGGKAWWFVLWGNMKTMSSKTFGQSPSATHENRQADQPPFMPNILVIDFIGNEHFWRSKIVPNLSIVQVAQLRNRKIIEKFSSAGKGQAVPDDEDDQYSDSTENAEEETGPASAPTTDETAKLGQKQHFFSQAWNAMATIFWAGGLGIHL
ncbi:unnamed protein product [Amoebophrya sp. A120]|nr:unnamed protein product [Amoebophrya sp. A120]|eukprot:GSA120T00008116001.1